MNVMLESQKETISKMRHLIECYNFYSLIICYV